MSNTTLELSDLEAVQRPDDSGVFDIIAVMDGPTGQFRVILPPIALLQYEVFQLVILERLGLVYRHAYCEGRDPVSANEKWRETCAFIRPIPAAPAETVN